MKVIKVTPRGYCHGVVSALQDVATAMANEDLKKPIYILGEIVHNEIITKAFKDRGVITLTGGTREELLKKIDTGTVIITAHGASRKVIDEALIKGLDVIDATCKDVYKTHNLIAEKINDGYDILYIGKVNHPEPEGVIAINPEKIHLISNIYDLKNLNISSENLMITNQTTMSMWDTKDIMEEATKLYPNIEIHNEICLATQQRQEAVLNFSKEIDLLIVVGDPKSNNTTRLAQISQTYGNTNAIRVSSLEDLNIDVLLDENINSIGVTSGASTPTIVTAQVINFIEQFEKNNKETWKKKSNIDLNKIIPRIKK